ncbi:hypothetical protein XPA_009542 [Xanthoria parietina]
MWSMVAHQNSDKDTSCHSYIHPVLSIWLAVKVSDAHPAKGCNRIVWVTVIPEACPFKKTSSSSGRTDAYPLQTPRFVVQHSGNVLSSLLSRIQGPPLEEFITVRWTC